MQPRLSLIIPVYNAELFIEDTVERLLAWKKGQNFSLELILVNDGSTDKTKDLLEDLNDGSKNFSLISYTNNEGKGYAVKQGMLYAKGDFKVFTDADIPYGLDVITNALKYLSIKEYDVCIGNRLDKDSNYLVKTSFVRKLSSKIFTFFITKFTIDRVGDTQCGLKGYTKSAADKIFSKTRIKGFAFDVECIYLCYKYHLNIKRIPVKFEGNNISTINLLNSSVKMAIDVLSLPIRYHLLKQY
ncbi:MAG: glycosyltransferase [Winogradskyella sp.]|nr:MAG: glycosyltransferase [Winogradskyella sp.]